MNLKRKANIEITSTTVLFVGLTFIALFLASSATYAGVKIFVLPDQGAKSFTNLVKAANEIEEFSLTSQPLIMKEESIIVGFAKDAEKVSLVASGQERGYLEKPESAACQDSACLCFCNEELQSQEKRIYCDAPFICRSVATDFPSKRLIQDYTLFSPEDQEKEITPDTQPNFWRGGLFIVNTQEKEIMIDIYGYVPHQVGENNALDKLVQEQRVVWIERLRDNINICLSDDCMTEEMRRELSQEST